MKKFKVNVKVPVQISWESELVENDENFYLRLKPHINTSGVSGAPRLVKTYNDNVGRYMMMKHYNYNQRALEEAKKKAKKESIPEVKQLVKQAAQSKKGTVTTRVAITKEDIEIGKTLR